MKKILVTMREGENNNYLTDTIDKRWFAFMKNCGLLPVLVPNNIAIAEKLTKDIFDGSILTGGDNIESLGGSSARDSVENIIIKYSIKNKIPAVGVCRGMQKIQDFFGVSLEKTPNNISINQEILINKDKHIVNSFHDFGTYKDSSEFKVWAKGYDGVIKAINHEKYKISGIMWHPERINPFREYDIKYFKSLFL